MFESIILHVRLLKTCMVMHYAVLHLLKCLCHVAFNERNILAFSFSFCIIMCFALTVCITNEPPRGKTNNVVSEQV